MSRLIDVDKIDWQKGVFVNPNTDEPLPVIHKIATIEMLRDWQEEVNVVERSKIDDIKAEIDKLTVYHTTEKGSELISKKAVYRAINFVLTGSRDIDI